MSEDIQENEDDFEELDSQPIAEGAVCERGNDQEIKFSYEIALPDLTDALERWRLSAQFRTTAGVRALTGTSGAIKVTGIQNAKMSQEYVFDAILTETFLNEIPLNDVYIHLEGKDLALSEQVSGYLSDSKIGNILENATDWPVLALHLFAALVQLKGLEKAIAENVNKKMAFFLQLTGMCGKETGEVESSFDPKQGFEFVPTSVLTEDGFWHPFISRWNRKVWSVPEECLPDGFWSRKILSELYNGEPRSVDPGKTKFTTRPGKNSSRPFLTWNVIEGFECAVVPVSTPESSGGVQVLILTKDTNFSGRLEFRYNGINTCKLINTSMFIPPRFWERPRRTLFQTLKLFLKNIALPPELSIPLLILSILGMYGLVASDQIIVIRFIGEGDTVKTTTPFNLMRLMNGLQPSSELKINQKAISFKNILYFDERDSKTSHSSKDQEHIEKLVVNMIDQDLKLIYTSGRSASSDANQVSKTLDFDTSMSSEHLNPRFTDEAMVKWISENRDYIHSYFITLLPLFLAARSDNRFEDIVVRIRAEYAGHIKIRQAENLAALYLMLELMEPDLVYEYGMEFTAKEIFKAFMAYQQRSGERIEAAKNDLVAKIKELARYFVMGGGPVENGPRYREKQRKIMGTIESWFNYFKNKYDRGALPFKDLDEFEDFFACAIDHLKRFGWCNEERRPGNRSAVNLIIPEEYIASLAAESDDQEELEENGDNNVI